MWGAQRTAGAQTEKSELFMSLTTVLIFFLSLQVMYKIRNYLFSSHYLPKIGNVDIKKTSVSFLSNKIFVSNFYLLSN